jgi:hypothetical protein
MGAVDDEPDAPADSAATWFERSREAEGIAGGRAPPAPVPMR